jgi:hypothetical protein
LPLLGEPCNKDQVSDGRHRTFHISIAQTMTVLSSLVYERQDHKVTQAYKLLDKSKHKEDMASQLIWESESRIRSIAAGYGLCFLGITELKSLGGPFCGIYWSETQPFIIIAFKGTTPTNYSEFLVDATLQRTDARGFLFGSAHEGFYHSLFPIQGDQDDERDPYFSIQETVIEKARYLQKKLNTAKPIQVWITGHSLGAATGSLLFARWLKCPEDLSIHCELRDAYVLGSPSVGDNDFASEFASYSSMPSTRSNMLWRIINKSDVICRIPPGYNNPTVGHYMQTTDFFNYSHVGHAVQITYPIIHAHPLKCYPSSYQPNLKVDIVAGDYDGHWDEQVPSKTSFWHRNPIPIIESFYPFFIRDHIPIHYFKGLERARVYYHSPCADPKKGNHT